MHLVILALAIAYVELMTPHNGKGSRPSRPAG